MNGQKLEALRDRIFAALGRGAAREARRGIEKLRRYEPAEAASLLTALCIEERDARALYDLPACTHLPPYERAQSGAARTGASFRRTHVCGGRGEGL